MQEDWSSSGWTLARGSGFRLAEECVSDPLPPISDAQFQTESDAQTRFVQANLRRIFLLIYRIVGNVDDAQDLTQETFIKALQRQSQLKDLDKGAQWLSRIASNTAIDFLRRNRNVRSRTSVSFRSAGRRQRILQSSCCFEASGNYSWMEDWRR
jgi:RNA polymerase sigma-70 factor (ECF subfamily)